MGYCKIKTEGFTQYSNNETSSQLCSFFLPIIFKKRCRQIAGKLRSCSVSSLVAKSMKRKEPDRFTVSSEIAPSSAKKANCNKRTRIVMMLIVMDPLRRMQEFYSTVAHGGMWTSQRTGSHGWRGEKTACYKLLTSGHLDILRWDKCYI